MTIEINELHIEREHAETSTTTQLPSHYYFYLLSFIGSSILLLLQPFQAPEVTSTHGWYSQPFIAPFVGLGIIAFFSGVYLLVNTRKHIDDLRKVNPIELAFDAISKYRTAVIISLFFVLYIASLSIIGFVLSSFTMILSMLWISNLFNRFWSVMAVVAVVVITVLFRYLVNLWLPDVWLYSLFPPYLADFANMYL